MGIVIVRHPEVRLLQFSSVLPTFIITVGVLCHTHVK